MQHLDRVLRPRPSTIRIAPVSRPFSRSPVPVTPLSQSASPSIIVHYISQRTLVPSSVTAASMAATSGSYREGADPDWPKRKQRPRAFAPLNPDVQDGRQRQKLKGIIFDVDGTLWYDSGPRPGSRVVDFLSLVYRRITCSRRCEQHLTFPDPWISWTTFVTFQTCLIQHRATPNLIHLPTLQPLQKRPCHRAHRPRIQHQHHPGHER